MGRKVNESFVAAFVELDKECSEKFGVANGGVTEYINRLNNARFAPGRDDILPRLVRYRNLRNKLTHEVSAMRKSEEVSKVDVKWLNSFKKSIRKKKDPISLYLRKARKYAKRRRARRRFSVLFATLLVLGAAVAAYFLWLR